MWQSVLSPSLPVWLWASFSVISFGSQGSLSDAALGTAHLWQQIHKCLLSEHRCFPPQLFTESQEVLTRKFQTVFPAKSSFNPRGNYSYFRSISLWPCCWSKNKYSTSTFRSSLSSSTLSGVGSHQNNKLSEFTKILWEKDYLNRDLILVVVCFGLSYLWVFLWSFKLHRVCSCIISGII